MKAENNPHDGFFYIWLQNAFKNIESFTVRLQSQFVTGWKSQHSGCLLSLTNTRMEHCPV